MAEPYVPVYLNGEIVTADQAKISVFDRGFMRGDGLFETMRSYGGNLFRLDDHLARLDHGLEVLQYSMRSADLNIRAAAIETLRASAIPNARVRVQITRGVGSTEFTSCVDTEPTVIVTIHPIADGEHAPLNVIVSSIRRDQLSPLSGIKTINYIPSLMARMEAERAGADDALLLNYAGLVAEGCASNVFLVKNGELITPDLASGALPGIIRRTVLEIANQLGLPAVESPVELGELKSADEVFMTSSVREVASVDMIDGAKVGQGTYEVAELLKREYRLRAEGVGS